MKKITVTSPSRCGLRHLVCHFSNDSGAKRRGGEDKMGDLKFKKKGERKGEGRREGDGCLHCLRCVLCCVKGSIDLFPLFFVLSSCVSFSLCLPPFTPPSLILFPLPLLLWGPIWLKWNLFLIFFLIKIWEPPRRRRRRRRGEREEVPVSMCVRVHAGGRLPAFH